MSSETPNCKESLRTLWVSSTLSCLARAKLFLGESWETVERKMRKVKRIVDAKSKNLDTRRFRDLLTPTHWNLTLPCTLVSSGIGLVGISRPVLIRHDWSIFLR